MLVKLNVHSEFIEADKNCFNENLEYDILSEDQRPFKKK